MEVYHTFLDTNVFEATHYNFNCASLKSLKKYCEKGMAKLYTNDVVVGELKRHFTKEVDSLARKAKNTIRNKQELVNALTADVYNEIKEKLLNAPNNLINDLDNYISNAIYLSNAGLSVNSLVYDYFCFNAPFEDKADKKHEFPDAIIIMSIKQFLNDNPNIILRVVTDDEGWHSALKGVPNLKMYHRLKRLLSDISEEEKELHENIVNYVNDNIDKIKIYISEWIEDQDWYDTVDNVDMCIECDEIDNVVVDALDIFNVTVEYIDVEEEYAIVTISAVTHFKISFSYIDHTDEIYDKEDNAWFNTKYGDGYLGIDMPLELSISIFFEGGEIDIVESPQYDDIVISDLTIVESDYKESVDRFSYEYFDTCPDCGLPIGIHNDGGTGFCINCSNKH